MEEKVILPAKPKLDMLTVFIVVMMIALIVYVAVSITTSVQKFEEPKELINKVDSLQKQNDSLKSSLMDLHNINDDYTIKIDSLNFQIDSLEKITTGIKKDHHTTIDKVRKYNDTQVDSFFKTRYKY
jgi:predicted PurR-regulated permease PerM